MVDIGGMLGAVLSRSTWFGMERFFELRLPKQQVRAPHGISPHGIPPRNSEAILRAQASDATGARTPRYPTPLYPTPRY